MVLYSWNVKMDRGLASDVEKGKPIISETLEIRQYDSTIKAAIFK